MQEKEQGEKHCAHILSTIVETMVPMINHCVNKIWCNLKKNCPRAYHLLRPYEDSIKETVEEERQALLSGTEDS